MIIAIDYDDTYTRDPMMWNDILQNMQDHGHLVYGVTGRAYQDDGMDDLHSQYCELTSDVYFTNGKAKRQFMADQGIHIDVWIDDSPEFILNDAVSEQAGTGDFDV